MIFDKDHYHCCDRMPYHFEGSGFGFYVCAWFYDMSGITFHIEYDGKGVVSNRNLPDIPREPEPNKDSVPKICPKGYAWETIDAKIKAFDPWITKDPEKKE